VNLDFLTPGAVADDASAVPVARSPMERSAAAAGAVFEVRDGWNVATSYGRGADIEAAAATETAGWADMSRIAKLELQGSGEAIEAAAGFPLPFGTAVRQDGAWWCRLTPTRALVTGAHPSPSIRERLSAAVGVNVVDVTTIFAALTIVGPLTREVFARFSAIDLRPRATPAGALRPGSVARQPGIVICELEDRYLYLFGWATGEYVWSVVADAGHHLGGRPIGVDALGMLPGPEPAPEAARA
jgi:glycine cleavage system aminomethyltransferase T